MRYSAQPWHAALARQETFLSPGAAASTRAELRAERCPSHEGPALCCMPTSAAAQCFLFCESHFDCHVFAFIAFPAPYMTHPQQDGGVRTELGCQRAPFPYSQPCSGQLSTRHSHSKQLFARLQELTPRAPISKARQLFTGQAHEGCPLPAP